MLSKIENIPFVLGSKSPRRKSIFEMCNLNFRIKGAEADESLSSSDAKECTIILAEKKADLLNYNKGEFLVTADTLVIKDNSILGKPMSSKEAKDMLLMLQNKWHSVITGVAVRSAQINFSFYEETLVYMGKLTDIELENYIETGLPFDKAGAYGIQEQFGCFFVEQIKGCYYNVMGFPMPRFKNELEKRLL